MRKFKNVVGLLLMGIIPLMAGCQTSTVDYAADFVNKYCDKPQQNRQILRHTVNSAIAPNAIYIECAQDLPTYTGEPRND